MANKYTVDQVKITAPAGGFQTGGWYNGRQYWNGTFSDPGVIHPESNQQGAGAAVSSEVLKSTSIAAGKAPDANEIYIKSLQQNSNPTGGGVAAAGTGTDTTVQSETDKKISELEATINTKKSEADKRRSEVNENPFLAEASRVGRISKIDTALNDSLQTEQAQLTYLQKQKEAEVAAAKPDYQITTETDDAGNVTVLTIDKKTGNIVNQTNAGKVGKGDKASTTETTNTKKTIINTTLSSNMNSYGHVDPETYRAGREAFVSAGLGTPTDYDKTYSSLTDPNRGDFNTAYGFDKTLRDKWTTGSKSQIDKLYELLAE